MEDKIILKLGVPDGLEIRLDKENARSLMRQLEHCFPPEPVTISRALKKCRKLKKKAKP